MKGLGFQKTVFSVPAVSTSLSYEFPPGLEVIENFISEKEEVLLFQLIDWKENPLDKAEGSVLKHRQVRHFGYEFQYGSNSVDKNKPPDAEDPRCPITHYGQDCRERNNACFT
ncbi:Alkylated DNA repair protein alkB 8 [Halocaridina rubra]|uniref:Alkylated DNA repair protein alkB 8 n=1 Tax=Halocaridina rubra TaxID=373956 RepID=A0AAN8XFA0_HALRR